MFRAVGGFGNFEGQVDSNHDSLMMEILLVFQLKSLVRSAHFIYCVDLIKKWPLILFTVLCQTLYQPQHYNQISVQIMELLVSVTEVVWATSCPSMPRYTPIPSSWTVNLWSANTWAIPCWKSSLLLPSQVLLYVSCKVYNIKWPCIKSVSKTIHVDARLTHTRPH